MSENEETVFLTLAGYGWRVACGWRPAHGPRSSPTRIHCMEASWTIRWWWRWPMPTNAWVTVRCASISRVGASAGDYDDGRGERDDLRAAVAFLEAAGKTVTDLAGYSFGAWINLGLDPLPAGVCRLLLVAPPVAYLEFDGMVAPPSVALRVVAGDRDSFAPLDMLRGAVAALAVGRRSGVLPGPTIFFSRGALDRLATLVETLLTAPAGP